MPVVLVFVIVVVRHRHDAAVFYRAGYMLELDGRVANAEPHLQAVFDFAQDGFAL